MLIQIKLVIKSFLKFIGIRVLKYKKEINFINTDDFIPTKQNDEDIKLYNAGMLISKSPPDYSKKMRLYSLIQIIKYVLNNNKIYDFVECGCWKGHSSFIIAQSIKNSKKKINFHIFDSFEGLSKITKKDKDLFFENNKIKNNIENQFSSSENFIKNIVLKKFKFVKIYKGWIPSRFFILKKKKFSFVHIDVDLYEPTFQSLEFFFPKLTKGGVIICDDYNNERFEGAKNAWDNYFKNKKYSFLYKIPFGGCYIIK
jgi:O-methyltransferase